MLVKFRIFLCFDASFGYPRLDRYDLINDIASVSHLSFDCTISLSHVLISFGGGSELLREGDTDGILHTIEQGMRYVLCLVCLPLFMFYLAFRKGFIFEHLPWLAGYAYKIPVIGRATRTVRETGRRKAQHRTKNGSTVKDLFYYLVSLVVITPPFFAAMNQPGFIE